jgi:hypothetical protein
MQNEEAVGSVLRAQLIAVVLILFVADCEKHGPPKKLVD